MDLVRITSIGYGQEAMEATLWSLWLRSTVLRPGVMFKVFWTLQGEERHVEAQTCFLLVLGSWKMAPV
eukprot:4511520-Amphidinium_carterae.1